MRLRESVTPREYRLQLAIDMSFWSSEKLKQRINGENLVRPYREARVKNASYELSLGGEVFVTGVDKKTKWTIAPGKQVVIPPGQFANLLTDEVVEVPADALGFISIKFKLKQRGLVNVSGFHVDPGFNDRLIFSVYNAGPRPVVLARGDQSFLLWFADLDQQTADTYKGSTGGSITSLFVDNLQGDIASPQALAERLSKVEGQLRGAKWLAGVVATAVISVLIGRANGWFDGNATTTTTTTTTTIATTSTTLTTSPSPTTAAVPSSSPTASP